MNHLQQCEAFYEARSIRDFAKAELENAEANYRRHERELINTMLEDGVKAFDLEDGTSVSLRKNFACSVNQDNEQMVRDWLTETDGDITKFEKLVLYKPAVVDWLKDKVEKGLIEQHNIPDFLNFSTAPTVMVRGWEGRTQ